jgi:CheY-like chemotaxis protein
MPRVDGKTAMLNIRAAAQRESAPCPCICACTASALHGDKEQALDAGFDDYIAKVRLEPSRNVKAIDPRRSPSSLRG